jgi:hypothetical protein
MLATAREQIVVAVSLAHEKGDGALAPAFPIEHVTAID